jgi:hypothetical protein
MAQGLLAINYCRATTNLRPRNGGTLNAFGQGHMKLIFKKSSIILLCTLPLSPDLCLKAGEGQYRDHVLEAPLKPLKTVSTVAINTTTPPCAPLPSHSRDALTAAATVTVLCNALTSSHKRSTMRCVSRWILSQYLQSLRKACPPLAATQSTRSSPYLGGRGNLGPN